MTSFLSANNILKKWDCTWRLDQASEEDAIDEVEISLPSRMLTSFHRRAAKALKQAFEFPRLPLDDISAFDSRDDTIVAPLIENAISGDGISVHELERPTPRNMRHFLQGRSIWAIDGGLLTWNFHQGVLVVGKVTVVRLKYFGAPSVEQVIEMPMLPIILEKVIYQPEESFAELLHSFFHHAMAVLPSSSRLHTGTGTTNYYNNPDEFFNTIPDELLSLPYHERESWKKRVDAMRETSEHVATIFCLKNARRGDIILRDGQIYGSYRFVNQLRYQDERGKSLLEYLQEEIKRATERGIRLIGVVKRPTASYCIKWFLKNGIETAAWYGSDGALYDELLMEGQRSNLWRLQFTKNEKKRSTSSMTKWFYENTGFFYVKTRRYSTPLRIEFCLHEDMYEQWIEEIANQVYYMALGSGHVAGLPHGIVIADNYAKVHRSDIHNMIKGIIEELEASSDEEDLELARYLRKKLFLP